MVLGDSESYARTVNDEKDHTYNSHRLDANFEETCDKSHVRDHAAGHGDRHPNIENCMEECQGHATSAVQI